MTKLKSDRNNFILSMHPLTRFLVSLAPAVGLYFVLLNQNVLLRTVLSWCLFGVIFLIFSWVAIVNRSVEQIKRKAPEDDGGVFFVFFMVIVSSFAGMLSVLLLLISKDNSVTANPLFLPACIAGMLISWTMVHTIYVFHYAHKFYDISPENPTEHLGGLDFPNEKRPNYLDFAYFSFVMGCTFQVSDVQITSRKIRHIGLLHGILSFVLNTFVVALTINLIAGLG